MPRSDRNRWPLWLFAAIVLVASPRLLGAPSAATGALDPSLVERAVKEASGLPRLHSLLVSRRGETVVEQYFGRTRPDRPANIKSASKSIISALVGIAIDRGLIEGVDQPIGDVFADHLPADDDVRRRAITIEDLLTMRSGLASTSSRNYGAWVLSRHWVRHILHRPMEAEPGETMRYSTGNTHLLSALLTEVTGRSTREFAQRVLADPLGFRLADWPRDPQGVYFGGNDMLLTPRQMLAFGNLYLSDGAWNGRQVVPADWIADSFVPRTRSPRSGRMYGYGWWIRDHSGRPIYFAWGYGGQFIFVVPSLDMVVVTTSDATPGTSRRGHVRAIHDLVDDCLVPAAEAADRTSQAAGF